MAANQLVWDSVVRRLDRWHLDRWHRMACRMHLDVPVKFPDGWEANQTMLAHLAAHHAD